MREKVAASLDTTKTASGKVPLCNFPFRLDDWEKELLQEPALLYFDVQAQQAVCGEERLVPRHISLLHFIKSLVLKKKITHKKIYVHIP